MNYTSELLKNEVLRNTAMTFSLLFPHKQDGIDFQQQYTAIYADLEVLLIDDCSTSKRFPSPSDSDFSDKYLGYIENLHCQLF